jgi:hypothetical protein
MCDTSAATPGVPTMSYSDRWLTWGFWKGESEGSSGEIHPSAGATHHLHEQAQRLADATGGADDADLAPGGQGAGCAGVGRCSLGQLAVQGERHADYLDGARATRLVLRVVTRETRGEVKGSRGMTWHGTMQPVGSNFVSAGACRPFQGARLGRKLVESNLVNVSGLFCRCIISLSSCTQGVQGRWPPRPVRLLHRAHPERSRERDNAPARPLRRRRGVATS